jgi:phosphoenolpyruvate phosphomutase
MSTPATKTARLRQLLEDGQLHFLMEAHNGMSARIVEQAGFEGIWGSGLSISAALGVRDSNEASWTQVLEVVEFMSDATSIPILLDGDTGYGNFNNARRLIRKLEQRGVAGVCIEDKTFPKTNSFIKGERQALADPVEFAGKISAMKDAQRDADFCVVARIEALIAGWGQAEALRRAELYHAAGADALLIHSKQRNAREVLEFKQAWGTRSPVVIVPTMYYATPTEVFEEAQFNVAIWANHLVRSSITAMEKTARKIHDERSLFSVEGEVVSVRHIFELQGADELAEAEKRYLPEAARGGRVVVLAAGRGPELGELTATRPKCMVEVRGRPILERQLEALRASGLNDITVVRGFAPECIAFENVRYVDNAAHAETRSAKSLALAMDDSQLPTVVAYGDIVYRKFVLTALLEDPHDITVVMDLQSTDRNGKPSGDYVRLPEGAAPRGWMDDEPLTLAGIARDGVCHGELIGLVKTSTRGTGILRGALDALAAESRLERADLSDVVDTILSGGHDVHVVAIEGHWVDVNGLADLAAASDF